MKRSSLHALIALQKIDRTLIQLKKEAQGIPGKKEAMDARCRMEQEALAVAETAMKENQNAIRQLELEVESVREQMNRYKTQQMSANSNEEYKILGHEIETCEGKIGELEDQELVLMEKAEPLQAAVVEAKDILGSSQAVIDADKGGLDDRLQVIRDQFEELKRQREPQVAELDESVEAEYRALLSSKDGLAVVPIEEGACRGCHMKLEPQTLHDAHAAMKWVYCGFCGRILYDPSVV